MIWVSLFQAFVETCTKERAGFVDYQWAKPNHDVDKLFNKLSYVQLVEKWNWVVGTGIYIDDIETSISEKKELLTAKIIKQSGIILLCLLFFCIITALISNIAVRKKIVQPIHVTIAGI